MQINRANDRAEDREELHVGVGIVARIKQIYAGVGGDGPVVVLARSIDARERLLMQKAAEAVALSSFLQNTHRDHLMIDGDICVLKGRCEFKLTRRDFVVASLDGNAQLEQPLLDLGHESDDALRNGAEIVILKLLPFGGGRANERATTDLDVGSLSREFAVDEEVLLLDAEGGDDVHALMIGAEDLQNAHRVLGDGLN